MFFCHTSLNIFFWFQRHEMEACRRKFQLWENKNIFLVRWEWSHPRYFSCLWTCWDWLYNALATVKSSTTAQISLKSIISTLYRNMDCPTHGHQRAESNCWTHFLLDREMPEKTCSILILYKCCLCVKNLKCDLLWPHICKHTPGPSWFVRLIEGALNKVHCVTGGGQIVYI